MLPAPSPGFVFSDDDDDLSSFERDDRFRRTHGILMLFAWPFCGVVSVFVARYMKGSLGKFWLTLHAFLMFLSLVITIAAVGLVIHTSGWGNLTENVTSTGHTIIGGVTILLGLFIQPFLGPVSDFVWRKRSKSLAEGDTLSWSFVEVLHGWIGRTVLVLSLVAVFKGFDEYNAISQMDFPYSNSSSSSSSSSSPPSISERADYIFAGWIIWGGLMWIAIQIIVTSSLSEDKGDRDIEKEGPNRPVMCGFVDPGEQISLWLDGDGKEVGGGGFRSFVGGQNRCYHRTQGGQIEEGLPRPGGELKHAPLRKDLIVFYLLIIGFIAFFIPIAVEIANA